MREQPEGLELLELAARVLREEVVPTLPESGRYAVLMVANAISIAGRQLVRDERPLKRARSDMAELLGAREDTDLDSDLRRLEAMLIRRIRQGTCDDDVRVKRVLWDVAEFRARESRPRYFETEGID